MEPIRLDKTQRRIVMDAVYRLKDAVERYQRVQDWGSDTSDMSDDEAQDEAETQVLTAIERIRGLLNGTEVVYFIDHGEVIEGVRTHTLTGDTFVTYEVNGKTHTARPGRTYDNEFDATIDLYGEDPK